MAGNNRRSGQTGSAVRAGIAVLVSALFFAVLAMLPSILPALHIQLHPIAPTTSYGVTLMTASQNPPPVSVPAVAQPVSPGQAPATPPSTTYADRETARVAAEDARIRAVLHMAPHIRQPKAVSVPGSRPTLVLPAAAGAYTAQTLIQHGAMVTLPNGAALLTENVYVAAQATLVLDSAMTRTLYLETGKDGFTTIVAWGGRLTFVGTTTQPLTIMGWDRAHNSPAADQGFGRSYIREVDGRMTFTHVRVSRLGFWSGRTGGVAWTGLTRGPATGGATDSTFTGDTYGSFVSRGSRVTFLNDLFESNQLDGLHIHRYSMDTRVTASSAVRNGANGFTVSPATQGTLLDRDIAEHNRGHGFFLNGRPLASGASASGGSVSPSAGTTVEYSAALNNIKTGILVEGGLTTVVKGDQVCGSSTGVEVKDGASNTVVTGNTVSCGPKSGISVGPSAPGSVLAGNAVDGARTAFMINNSGHVQVDSNLVTRATVFGVFARGATSAVGGVDNRISGTGFRAIYSSAGAPVFSLGGSNLSGWAYHAKVNFFSYLQYHPLAAMWLGIATLLLLAFLWSRRGRAPSHPYPASTRWRPGSTLALAAGLPRSAPFPAARATNTAWQASAARQEGTARRPGRRIERTTALALPSPPRRPEPATRGRRESRPEHTVRQPTLNRNEQRHDRSGASAPYDRASSQPVGYGAPAQPRDYPYRASTGPQSQPNGAPARPNEPPYGELPYGGPAGPRELPYSASTGPQNQSYGPPAGAYHASTGPHDRPYGASPGPQYPAPYGAPARPNEPPYGELPYGGPTGPHNLPYVASTGPQDLPYAPSPQPYDPHLGAASGPHDLAYGRPPAGSPHDPPYGAPPGPYALPYGSPTGPDNLPRGASSGPQGGPYDWSPGWSPDQPSGPRDDQRYIRRGDAERNRGYEADAR